MSVDQWSVSLEPAGPQVSNNSWDSIGLDGLRGRLTEYYQLGARFTKWRVFYHRAYVVSAARQGVYTPEIEAQLAGV